LGFAHFASKESAKLLIPASAFKEASCASRKLP